MTGLVSSDELVGHDRKYRLQFREISPPLYLISAIQIGMAEPNDQHPTSNPKFRAGRLYLRPEDLRRCWSNPAQRSQSPMISQEASLLP
jgi:hypothetical protein